MNSSEAENSCEVLVIGTGAGGASVADMLSEAGLDVLMIEEGAHIPAADAPQGISESMRRMWRGGGLMSTLGSQVAFAEGRCVGGGTEINSAIFQQAPESVLERWRAANQLDDMSADALAPYYDRAARAVNASQTPGQPSRVTGLLAQAGQAMGWRVTSLERGQRNCVGTNLCSAACPTGGKQSMSATLIPQARMRGARLLSSTRAKRLLHRNGRVTGALVSRRDESGRDREVFISASWVFVAAGTMQTPLLLRRSGISRLAGNSFQLHPTIRLLARFPETVDAQRDRLPLVAITEFMPELRFGGSIFTLGTYGMALAENWQHQAGLLPDYAHHAMYYAMIKPDGAGRIRSIPGMADPLATYSLTERDWRRLSDGAQKLAAALFAAGAQYITPAVRGHDGWASTAAAAADPVLPRSRTSLMTIHLFSSCPMGNDADHFPVDGHGRVFGFDNLMVADGSLLPSAPGVNPQATIMALAYRAADAFLALR